MNARDEDKRPEQIENEIEHTRAEVSATIDAIQSKLTPGQLMDQTMGYLRTSLPADFGSNLSRSIRDNPLPVALLGIGLAWLMMGGQPGRRGTTQYAQDFDDGLEDTEAGSGIAERAGAAGERMKAHASQLSGRAREAADSVREKIGASTESARARLNELGSRSRERYERARGSVSHAIEEQPLVLGAVGLAVGAVLGASLPRTRQEDEFMGETRDRLLDSAKQSAREQVDSARQAMGDDGQDHAGPRGDKDDALAPTRREQPPTTSIGHMEAP
jgi:ElaB/YqjD/DUF883 family membrane-anchored ribosome-binding protein